ncbi:LCP family protein [Deinococcus sonorensis]|uniref:LCP family protein n=2 Tax=Deinococcus sonorensis TaxID=309891 RepID=A0AAU7UDE7_9DEIO
MPRLSAALALLLAGLTALAAPAVPALLRYGGLPHTRQQPLNLLLAGVTPRYDDTSAVWPWPAKPEAFDYITDTIVLAQVRADGTVRMLSIPRDTWMNIPKWGFGKINGANAHGGPQMLVAAVQQLTGLSVDAYTLLSLNALRDLTDAAGGVQLNVPEAMKYDDDAGHLHIDLKAGPQRLNGHQAEGFLRFRHDALGDIGRVTRQQLFLGALAARLKSPLNIWRIPAVVGALDRNTKSNLSRSEAGALLSALLHGPKVGTTTLPGNFGPGGTWTPDRAAIRTLVRRQFAGSSDPRGLDIALVNIDAPPGSAARLKAQLEADGYRSVQIVSEPRHSSAQTTVSGDTAAARALVAQLGYGAPDAAAPASDTDLTVRLGSDVPAP